MFLFYAVISLIGWGTGDFFGAIAARRLGSYNTSFYTYAICAVYGLAFIPFALGTLHYFTTTLLLFTVFLAIIQALGYFAFCEGIKIGNSSLVGTIGGSFTSLVVILSVIFLGDRLNAGQLVAIIGIFIGLLFSSVNFSEIRNIRTIINKGNLYGLLAMIGWGIYFTFIKIPVEHAGFFWPTMITNCTGALFFALIGFKKIKGIKKYIHKGIPAALASGLLGSSASYSYNYAIGNGLSSIVAPIAGGYPAIFVLLAYFYFKDPLSTQQKIGMVVMLCGIVLLSFLSV